MRQGELDKEDDVDKGSTAIEFVCGVDVEEDANDDLVTADYKSLRDVDGWHRRDPWGGSAESRPNPPTTIPIILSTSSSLYNPATPIAISTTAASVGPRQVRPLSDDGRRAETQESMDSSFGMSEANLLAL